MDEAKWENVCWEIARNLASLEDLGIWILGPNYDDWPTIPPPCCKKCLGLPWLAFRGFGLKRIKLWGDEEHQRFGKWLREELEAEDTVQNLSGEFMLCEHPLPNLIK